MSKELNTKVINDHIADLVVLYNNTTPLDLYDRVFDDLTELQTTKNVLEVTEVGESTTSISKYNRGFLVQNITIIDREPVLIRTGWNTLQEAMDDYNSLISSARELHQSHHKGKGR